MHKMINYQPQRLSRVLLGLLPLILLIVVYMVASDARLSVNASDKLLPSFSDMGNTIYRAAFEPDPRTGQYILWSDTLASLTRLLSGILLSTLIGLSIGLFCGAIPVIRATISPLTTLFSLIPPLAILPILFILFGLGELSKIVLITIGMTPFIARDLQHYVQSIPHEQLIKAQTLGGHTGKIIWRIILPQLLPRLFDAVRLSLGSAWLFLIAAEAIASTDGLGYRIFLMRRYLAMDVILPYVAWITLLAFIFDAFLCWVNRRFWPWYFVK